MAIKVLHVFSPDYKSRFRGPTFTWKYNFSNWNDRDVDHYVLDTENHRVVDARDAFDFEYPAIQKEASRWERALWIFPLFGNLVKHKGEYDILHLHVFYWASLLIGPWAKWKKIPVLYESVLLDEDTPGGVVKSKFGRLQVWLMKSYQTILAISEALAEDYRKFGFSASQVFTLVNCVDDKLFSPAKSAEEKISLRQKINIPSDAIVLVFVGSVIERKGVDVLVRAYVEASAKCPDLYLLIVGPNNKNENPSLDEGFVNDLYSLLIQNNLSERVSFIGLIQDRQNLAEVYRASDIFVFPSNKEGLGNVILEAMASGLPVLVSRLPVLDKIIKHGENGLVVPIGDIEALKDAILMLSNNSAYAKKLGVAAKNYVRGEHGFATWQSQLIEFYKSLH
jgi:glycosyltransferase involved in cell wall biosynthesis